MTQKRSTTLDIGQLSGPLLVFGGVYSNFQALQALMKLSTELKIPASNVICTGDIIGYCAQPEECVQAIMEWGIHSIAGNVELQLAQDRDDCGCDFVSGGSCDGYSKQWYPYAQKSLGESALGWIKRLPEFIKFRYSGLDGIVIHGSLSRTAEYIFKSTPWRKKNKNFKESQTDLILAGHSGIPFNDYKEGKNWLNAGVIGMPANDGSTETWFMILSDRLGKLGSNFHRLPYDFKLASQLMNQAGLPSAYAQTLETGIWDNCEILPEEETFLQGLEIVI